MTASIELFPGQFFDQESGLNYNYFRDYDPKTGRYIEPDPIGISGGPNLFIYSINNPINVIDPFGLRVIDIILKGDPASGYVRDIPGSIVINGHGSSGFISNGRYGREVGKYERLDASDIVRKLLDPNEWNWNPEEPIIINSCKAAEKGPNGSPSLIEQVAKKLRTKGFNPEVWGYSERLRHNSILGDYPPWPWGWTRIPTNNKVNNIFKDDSILPTP